MVSQTTLYLFRHVQTEWSVSGQHTGSTDIPLTEAGWAQAALLRAAVSHLQFSKVLVSPLSRARETAVLAGLESQITPTPDLVEFDYGTYEGLTTAQIREKVPDWTVWSHPCPDGETLDLAATRCRRVIDTAHGAGGAVAIFAHGHILRILTATWLELPPREGRHFILDTSTISILAHERETPAIKLWNGSLGVSN